MDIHHQNRVATRRSNRAPFVLAITTLFLPALGLAQGYLISTFAGTGTGGYSGNGGPAIGAKLNEPYGVATDSVGNVYVSDSYNNSVRKISTTGTISTVAGSDSQGYTGDGGLAINATLYDPQGLAVDKSGNLYIADNGNHVIRMVSAATGNISTVAGGGNGCVQQTDSVGDGCPAGNASLNYPTGVAVDGNGNLYIADQDNYRIRKVSGGIITSAAGNGRYGYSGDGGLAINAELAQPHGVAVDSMGQVYIADTGNELVRMINLSGDINTVAGTSNMEGYTGDGSPAVDALLDEPTAVALDAAGNLYIADTYNGRIREVLASNGNISTIAGSGSCNNTITPGPALNAPLCDTVWGLAVFGTSVYIADEDLDRVFLLAPAVPPGPVTIFSPSQGATGVSLTPTLSWAPATGATSYDIYFGDPRRRPSLRIPPEQVTPRRPSTRTPFTIGTWFPGTRPAPLRPLRGRSPQWGRLTRRFSTAKFRWAAAFI